MEFRGVPAWFLPHLQCRENQDFTPSAASLNPGNGRGRRNPRSLRRRLKVSGLLSRNCVTQSGWTLDWTEDCNLFAETFNYILHNGLSHRTMSHCLSNLIFQAWRGRSQWGPARRSWSSAVSSCPGSPACPPSPRTPGRPRPDWTSTSGCPTSSANQVRGEQGSVGPAWAWFVPVLADINIAVTNNKPSPFLTAFPPLTK